MPGRQLEESERQFSSRACAQLARELRRHHLARPCPLLRDARQLLVNPRALTVGERLRFALRSPARNRHSNRAVIADAHHVPPRAGVPDEDRFREFTGFAGLTPFTLGLTRFTELTRFGGWTRLTGLARFTWLMQFAW